MDKVLFLHSIRILSYEFYLINIDRQKSIHFRPMFIIYCKICLSWPLDTINSMVYSVPLKVTLRTMICSVKNSHGIISLNGGCSTMSWCAFRSYNKALRAILPCLWPLICSLHLTSCFVILPYLRGCLLLNQSF